MHQRVNKNGEITDDSLCSALLQLPGDAEDADFDTYRLSPSQTLIRLTAAWGSYWTRERAPLDPTIFTKDMRSAPVERAAR